MGSRKALSKRVQTLQRRCEHLRRRIEDPERRERSKGYDRQELEALELAMEALERYRAEYQLGTTAVELLERLRPRIQMLLRADDELEQQRGHDTSQNWQGTRELLEDVEMLLKEIAA